MGFILIIILCAVFYSIEIKRRHTIAYFLADTRRASVAPKDKILPPYFNISADAALAELGDPVVTDDFERIAPTCSKGRDDLMSRGIEADSGKELRLFLTWEITKYLIPVVTQHFRRVLKANPKLPKGLSETDGGDKWFTLDEVLQLRNHFAT